MKKIMQSKFSTHLCFPSVQKFLLQICDYKVELYRTCDLSRDFSILNNDPLSVIVASVEFLSRQDRHRFHKLTAIVLVLFQVLQLMEHPLRISLWMAQVLLCTHFVICFLCHLCSHCDLSNASQDQ